MANIKALFKQVEFSYLDVLGSFLTAATALTRGFGDKPVLQTRSPKGTTSLIQTLRRIVDN